MKLFYAYRSKPPCYPIFHFGIRRVVELIIIVRRDARQYGVGLATCHGKSCQWRTRWFFLPLPPPRRTMPQ